MISTSGLFISAVLLVVAFATPNTMNGARTRQKDLPLKVDGCVLLRNPAKFNNKLVEVTGRAYGAFESWSISFDCPGSLNLSQSLYEPDIHKYGFRTLQDEKMDQFNHLLFPNDILTSREPHYARVTLIGRFRCHYDFPNCRNISIDGDSSIIISSVSSVFPDDTPNKSEQK